MRTLYLDLSMGAAGDMLTAALLELFNEGEQDDIIWELNDAGIPGTLISAGRVKRYGIEGTHVHVRVNGTEEEDLMASYARKSIRFLDQYTEQRNGGVKGQAGGHSHAEDEEHGHFHGHEHDHAHDVKSGSDGHSHDAHEHGGHHHGTGLYEVTDIINRLRFSIKVKTDIVNVYNMIAEAESTVHGMPVTDIHFHEVGTMDAIMDVAAVCYIMDKLSPDQVCASPVHVGAGTVHCAHGVLPVPAPATAEILKDVPVYGGEIQGELCTPTGAALVKYFVNEFGGMPAMKTEKIGYGIGAKDFGRLNSVRAMIGDTGEARENVLEMTANIDDMTAEEIGFAMERLFDAGALDVFTTPIGMKKSRPGTMLHVLCRPARRELLAGAIFKYTTTLGIREQEMKRHVLSRKIREVETEYGTVRVKISSGYGVKRRKIEYDDMAKIAKEKGISLSEVKKSVEKGMKPRKTYRID
ncbi:MAG: nickel pincer cofactor biosynthesis protein LarC [Lachnospiraceae bacterium]|nr:nickel pincer cofactor biosynthesis protein LarC [Lachnospiraceae bacterium]